MTARSRPTTGSASPPARVVAVDLGASGGRVLAGSLVDGAVRITEHARFANAPVAVPSATRQDLRWDILGLWREICEGLRDAAAQGHVDSVGIDSWAVDYANLDADGRLIGNPAAYRSDRTAEAVGRLHRQAPPVELYARTGIQAQAFNTAYQLIADTDTASHGIARTVLLIPDLLGYWLTGTAICEVTNASTTGMIDPATRSWDPDTLTLLRDRLGVPVPDVLAPLTEPGTFVGPVRPPGLDLQTGDGRPTPLVAVGSHDTASAVVSLPVADAGAKGPVAFICTGTWSLVGVELSAPVRTEQARAANFTNELGVDNTVRFLKNVTGMWVQQECLRHWRTQGMGEPTWEELEHDAEAAEARRTLIDVNDPEFLPPGDMPARIDAAARRVGEPEPRDRGEYLRTIRDSLAIAHRRALRDAGRLTGSRVDTVHLVGGASRSRLLCQLTADATGRPVVAGPGEGAALGNMLIQLRAIGALKGDLPSLRAVAASSADWRRHEPRADDADAWDEAERRLGG